jgi:hypothetical protein
MTTHTMMMITQKKTQSYIERTLGNDFIPLVIETYRCFHSHFDSLFTIYAYTTITCHRWSYLVPSMLVFYYRQHVSITLQHAQAMVILQQVVTLGRGLSFLPHIIVNAPSLVANLW